MRIATYNVEWMNSLFDDTGNLRADKGWSGRYNVTRAQQIKALGVVFKALDADAIMVIEAPDTTDARSSTHAVQQFARRFDLRANKAVTGFSNGTQQEITLLFDPNAMSARHDPVGPQTDADGRKDAPRFDGVFRLDMDVDEGHDRVVFSKPPLELAVETARGFSFRMIGAHLKSKAPHGAKTDDDVMRMSIANRRKQLAQATWLRQRIVQHLDDGVPLMVMGDLNDGPGLDEYENLFGRSSVEIILGAGDEVPLFDPHARLALQRRLGAAPTTSRFWIHPERRFLQALLDYIMVSEGLRAKDAKWRIWHPLDDPECWAQPALRDALVTASDHFPVTLDIDL
jgi:hypothetical protein